MLAFDSQTQRSGPRLPPYAPQLLRSGRPRRLSPNHDACALHLLPGLLRVAPVGKQTAPRCGYQQGPRAAREAAEITNVGKMGDEQKAQPRRMQFFAQPLLTAQVIHRVRV